MRSLLRSIGGEFPVTCQDFVVKEQQGTGAWPEYAGKQHLRCDSGRSALLLALRHWQRENAFCKVVWLPSYLCPSIPNTVYQAGLRVCIYEDGPGEALPFMPPTPLDGDLVLIVHYFGHVNTRALDWLSREPLRNWGVIEDCVQTPYSVGVGDAGNYVITSMRKWWPAPDGATLHFQGELWAPFMLESDEGFVSGPCWPRCCVRLGAKPRLGILSCWRRPKLDLMNRSRRDRCHGCRKRCLLQQTGIR
jgi:hypothetical protein